ncbi:MAG: acetyl-CoA carboxylase biotin carboxyl carrier protein subunit [Bacteroidaceae bacterium]|nr:acetyl-CoA carboxylase biotin carboxyl carrier protein subunit [Bacteroidaceae bacterium]
MAKYIINGKEYNVEITDVQGNLAKIKVNGTAYEVETEEKLHAMPTQSAPVAKPVVAHVAAPVAAAPVVAVAPVVAAAPVAAAAPAAGGGSGTKVTAPLPGTITEVKCSVGQAVKSGDVVIVLEAMKMQNNIEAECNGTIKEILVGKGDSVMEGSPLVVIE